MICGGTLVATLHVLATQHPRESTIVNRSFLRPTLALSSFVLLAVVS